MNKHRKRLVRDCYQRIEGSPAGTRCVKRGTSEELATFLLQKFPRFWNLETPMDYAVTVVGLHISRRVEGLWSSAQQQVILKSCRRIELVVCPRLF